jgi:hypothetical protein
VAEAPAIALDKHANGLTSLYQGRWGQKEGMLNSPWFFHFKPLASSVCQEFASPIADLLKGSAKQKVRLIAR